MGLILFIYVAIVCILMMTLSVIQIHSFIFKHYDRMLRINDRLLWAIIFFAVTWPAYVVLMIVFALQDVWMAWKRRRNRDRSL